MSLCTSDETIKAKLALKLHCAFPRTRL